MQLPDFKFERKYWKIGYSFVIGVDEVGRGSLSGPVVAAAAVVRLKNYESGINNKKSIHNLIRKLGINDSKKLSPKRRDILSLIIPRYFHCSVGMASVGEINRLGIVEATNKAMGRAIKRIINQELRIKIIPTSDFLLPTSVFIIVDGFPIKSIKYIGPENQEGVIRGDGKSITIAAASIIAKVYRDNLMSGLSLRFNKYGWEYNKGYGTRLHIEAIRKYGVTKMHRIAFVDNL